MALLDIRQWGRQNARAKRLHSFEPLRTAAFLALAYLVLCLTYIWVSGRVAARLAETVNDLQLIETYKGMAFVVVSSGLLFLLSWGLFRGLARKEAEIARQQEILVAADRKALAGMLASSVAHDINNILTILTFGLDQLSPPKTPAAGDPGMLEEMKRATENMKKLARRLMESGRDSMPGFMVPVDLVALARETLDLGQGYAKRKDCRLTLASGPGSVELIGNPTVIQQMLLNLIINATEAVSSGKGCIELRLFKTPEFAVVEVHDNGPGIPPDKRDRVFDANFSTKMDHVGLGLLSVKACAAFHKGTVALVASDLGGACFRITLPLTAELNAIA